MAGQRHVFLHLRELGGQDHAHRVLLPIHRALLQRGEQLGESHGRGQDAEGLVAGHVHLVFHGAHLQAARVRSAGDGPLAVGHVAEAVLAPGQRDQALGRELGQQVLADLAVEHLAGVVVVAEQERDVQDLDVWHEVAHRAGGGDHRVLRAQLHRFDLLAFTAQGAGREHLAFVAAGRAFLHLVAEHRGAHVVMRTLGLRVADLQDGLGLRRRRGEQQGAAQGGGEQLEGMLGHGCLLLEWIDAQPLICHVVRLSYKL